jgi:hypothetical protein
MSMTVPIAPISYIQNLGLYVYFAKNSDYIISTFKTDTQNLGYYIDSYDVYRTEVLTRLQEQNRTEDKSFLISYNLHRTGAGSTIKGFGGIGDKVRTLSSTTVHIFIFPTYVTRYGYSNLEQSRLNSLYGEDSEVSLQFDITPREPSRTPPQNLIETLSFSYDSLSSLGPISSEGFTISSTSATDTEDIESGTEVITDVGGVVSRDRAIDQSGVSSEIVDRVRDQVEAEFGSEAAELLVDVLTTQQTSQVRTSGY